jgi:mono/diheme cytochrome c family protein
MIARGVVVGLAAVGLALPAGRPGNAGNGGEDASQAAGKSVYDGKGNCAACHGAAGKGTPLGPDLTDGEWLNFSGAVEDVAKVVREGVTRPKKYPAPMPAMGGARLSGDEIDAVARYVVELGAARGGE